MGPGGSLGTVCRECSMEGQGHVCQTVAVPVVLAIRQGRPFPGSRDGRESTEQASCFDPSSSNGKAFWGLLAPRSSEQKRGLGAGSQGGCLGRRLRETCLGGWWPCPWIGVQLLSHFPPPLTPRGRTSVQPRKAVTALPPFSGPSDCQHPPVGPCVPAGTAVHLRVSGPLLLHLTPCSWPRTSLPTGQPRSQAAPTNLRPMVMPRQTQPSGTGGAMLRVREDGVPKRPRIAVQ